MGEIINKIIVFAGAIMIISIFIGWWSIPLVILNGIAQAILQHYQKKRENDPKYIAKKKEELKREIEEDKRKEAEYARLREENLRRYSD